MLFTDDASTPCSTLDPHIWFDKNRQAEAKSFCKTECPRLLQCLEETLTTEFQMGQQLEGVHGGLTKAERLRTSIKRLKG